MDSPLANIRIVLVRTTHPGNIGAAARAMKTMGLSSLRLVQPARFPAPEATAMASGADDLLAAASVCADLPAALAGAGVVIGTSARRRSIPWPPLTPRECARRLLAAAAAGPVALVFGCETSGLSNEDLELCHGLVQIPTVESFSSLNVGAAVQVLAYEIHALWSQAPETAAWTSDAPPATADQLERLYAHLREAMTQVGFYDPAKPRRLMRRLRRLFGRAGLDQHEIQILRGFLAAVQERLGDPPR
ncbi:MAG: RNA methyltransferase [Gammaproteobacteria bacterium]